MFLTMMRTIPIKIVFITLHESSMKYELKKEVVPAAKPRLIQVLEMLWAYLAALI
jgi:hypothetical protein